MLEDVYRYIDDLSIEFTLDNRTSFQMKYIMKNVYEGNTIKLAIIGDGNDIVIHELCKMISDVVGKKINVIQSSYSNGLSFESIGRHYSRLKPYSYFDYYRNVNISMTSTIRGIEFDYSIITDYVGTDSAFDFINQYINVYTTILRFIRLKSIVSLEDTVNEYTKGGFIVI